MPPGDGWYVIGPLVAVALVGFLGAVFWRAGPSWPFGRDRDVLRDIYPYGGLTIFDSDDYGLLCPAAVTDHLGTAEELRGLLVSAGIRATLAVRRDGRVLILVFAEELEEARRLVGDSPAGR